MEVTWRVAGIYNADAQKVAEEIGNGKITPEEVLKRQRTKIQNCTSVLNGMTAWRQRSTDYSKPET